MVLLVAVIHGGTRIFAETYMKQFPYICIHLPNNVGD